MREGQFSELSYGMLFAGGDDVIFRLVLLQHEPHGPHVLARMAPVPTRIQIAQPDFFRQAELDPCGLGGDLSRHELKPPARRLVVVEDAGRGPDAISLPIVARQVEAGHFGDPVRGARMETRHLVLRHLRHLAEHLAGGREIEPAVRRAVAQRG